MATERTKLRIRFLVQQQDSLDVLRRLDDVHAAYLALVASSWFESGSTSTRRPSAAERPDGEFTPWRATKRPMS